MGQKSKHWIYNNKYIGGQNFNHIIRDMKANMSKRYEKQPLQNPICVAVFDYYY